MVTLILFFAAGVLFNLSGIADNMSFLEMFCFAVALVLFHEGMDL